MSRSWSDPDTEFTIVDSGTPPSVDGFSIEEPKFLRCVYCGVQTLIDGPGETETTIDDLHHRADCPQKEVKSRITDPNPTTIDDVDAELERVLEGG